MKKFVVWSFLYVRFNQSNILIARHLNDTRSNNACVSIGAPGGGSDRQGRTSGGATEH